MNVKWSYETCRWGMSTEWIRNSLVLYRQKFVDVWSFSVYPSQILLLTSKQRQLLTNYTETQSGKIALLQLSNQLYDYRQNFKCNKYIFKMLLFTITVITFILLFCFNYAFSQKKCSYFKNVFPLWLINARFHDKVFVNQEDRDGKTRFVIGC